MSTRTPAKRGAPEGNGNRLTHGAYSKRVIQRTAQELERRLFSQVELVRSKLRLGVLDAAYLDDFLCLAARVDRLDTYGEEHGRVGEGGELPGFARDYLVALNGARRNLDSLAKHGTPTLLPVVAIAYQDGVRRVDGWIGALEEFYEGYGGWPQSDGTLHPSAAFYLSALNTRRQLLDSLASLRRIGPQRTSPSDLRAEGRKALAQAEERLGAIVGTGAER